MKLYVVFDRVAEQASNVFEAVNDGTALRHLERLRAGSDWASDFTLWRVGERPEGVARIVSCEPVEVIAKVSDVEADDRVLEVGE